MGIIYRVTVTAEETTPGSDYDTETLFELAGGAELIGRLAPAAVIEAVAQRTEAVRAGLAERVMDAAAAAGAPVAPASHPFQGEQPARRPRRTKAQIAADTEAQSLGFRDAAHRAEVEAVVTSAVPSSPATDATEVARLAGLNEAKAGVVEGETSAASEVAAPALSVVRSDTTTVAPSASAEQPAKDEAAAYNPFQVR